MKKATLENAECLLLIENIQKLAKLAKLTKLAKLAHKILSGMECFQNVVFIEYILILMNIYANILLLQENWENITYMIFHF
jgi:hypothetical protein